VQKLKISPHRHANSIFHLHFDIVHGCQLRCVGCPNSTLQPKVKRISVDDFNICLGNIDVQAIHTMRLFNYGEPLLHKQLAEIVEQISRQKWKTSIVEISTNGQKVNWVDFENMLKLQVVNSLIISCDGDGTPEKYERLRPPSKWEKFMEFLERARELRDRWSPATQLRTRTVIDDAGDKNHWNKLLRPLGWQPEFRGWMNLPEAKEHLSNRKIQVPEKACYFLADPSRFRNKLWCGEVNLLYVDYDGTVVPCCIHPQAGRLGNLMHNTYNQILNSSKRMDFINTMNSDRASMSICGNCEMGPPGNEGPSFWSVPGRQELT
jgi:radical SAM protein with 4Fe4S-binding SPASM domain